MKEGRTDDPTTHQQYGDRRVTILPCPPPLRRQARMRPYPGETRTGRGCPCTWRCCAGWGYIGGSGNTWPKATAPRCGNAPDAGAPRGGRSTSANGGTYASAPANRYGSVDGAAMPTVKGPATIGGKTMISRHAGGKVVRRGTAACDAERWRSGQSTAATNRGQCCCNHYDQALIGTVV